MEHLLRRKTTNMPEYPTSSASTALKKTSSKERATMHRSMDTHRAGKRGCLVVMVSIEINATTTLHRTTINSITGRSTTTTTRKVEVNGTINHVVTLKPKLQPKQKLEHGPGLRPGLRLGLRPELPLELRLERGLELRQPSTRTGMRAGIRST